MRKHGLSVKKSAMKRFQSASLMAPNADPRVLEELDYLKMSM
jgi:hypothetical protein